MRVLLLSPHTDDVEIGAGGLVARLQSTGTHRFLWVVFSICSDSLPAGWPRNTLEREFRLAAAVLGIADVTVFNYTVRSFSSHRQAILETLIALRRDFRPELVVAPCLDDVHQDHATISAEAVRAFKNSSTILGYEQPWNNIHFAARVLVRLSSRDVERKWLALSSYQSQVFLGRAYLQRESVFALARTRGGQCDCQYAEAFDLPRCVV